MDIKITDSALNWFKDEVGIESGENIRFHIQIYGSSPVQEGYSLAFSKGDPTDRVVSKQKEGISFFIEEDDLWFFNGHDLVVDYDKELDEVKYKYIKS